MTRSLWKRQFVEQLAQREFVVLREVVDPDRLPRSLPYSAPVAVDEACAAGAATELVRDGISDGNHVEALRCLRCLAALVGRPFAPQARARRPHSARTAVGATIHGSDLMNEEQSFGGSSLKPRGWEGVLSAVAEICGRR